MEGARLAKIIAAQASQTPVLLLPRHPTPHLFFLLGLALHGVMSTAKATGSKRGRSSGVAAAAVESDDDGSRRSNSQASASEKEPGRGRGRNPKALKSDPKPRVKSTGRLRDCGRASCTAKETAQDRFPDGSVAACERCLFPWEWAWKEKHPSWPKFCNQLNQDKNLDEQFERCCKCSEDSRQKTFAEETVDIVNRSGFRMCSHFRVWNEDSLRDATSMPTDVEPKDLDLKISSIKFPSGASVQGYVTVNPDIPFVDVDRIDEHIVEQRTRALSSDRHLVKEQGKKS
eukprot:1750552-Pyramimonas_sp.AAC.1